MGRLRKDKGEKATTTAPKAGPSQPKKARKDAGADALKGQVRALGGDDGDVQLLSGVGDGMVVQGAGPADAALSQDVSRFMKGLNFGGSSTEPAPSGKKEKKSKEDKAAAKAAPRKNADAASTKPAKPSKGAQEGKRAKADEAAPPETKRAGKEPRERKPKPSRDFVAPPRASTSAAAAAAAATPTFAPPKNGKMLFPPASDWYSFAEPLAAPATPLPSPSAAQIASLSATAAELHAAELATFSSGPNSGLVASTSDQAFLKNILASGTMSDRLSALTLMAQSSPLHNTRALDVLKGMAEKGRGGGPAKDADKGKGKGAAGSRDERLKAARAIVDWWVGGGSPERKLKYFRDQPLLHPDVTNKHLLVWYFEDWLKKYFFSLLQVLEMLLLDTLPYVRMQALTFVYQLLRARPEQEHNLLRLLINKLGDSDKAVCSRASYYILQLLQGFPDMKVIVIREMTALVMRPAASSAAASTLTQSTPAAPTKKNTHIKFADEDDKPKPAAAAPAPARPQDRSTWNVHARYYAAITFNQIVLTASPKDRDAARALMDVYFRIFRDVVGERSSTTEGDGGEKAEPEKGAGANKGRDAFNGIEGKAKRRSLKAKAKEVQGAAGFAEVQDESSRLVSAILTGVNRALPFAKFGAQDGELERHMDTLFLISHTSTFNITIQALTLVHHVIEALAAAPASSSAGPAAGVVARYYRTLYATLFDARVFSSNKQAMYLNLLYKSLKGDADHARARAFVHRFCQVLAGGFGGNEFVAGGLWLLGEFWGNVPELRAMMQEPARAVEDEKEAYDPRKRDPQFAHADATPLWELVPLLNHFHPAIALLTRQLLAGEPLTSSPDLSLHTLTHFLDRFVYKNPKKVKAHGASAMQPAAAPAGEGVRKLKGGLQDAPVNQEGWWKRGEAAVPVDQLFFHKYFSQKAGRAEARAGKVGKRKGKGDDEDGSEEEDGSEPDVDNLDESDEDEAEIWKAMKASMPKEAGDDEMDAMSDVDDDLPSDLPSDFGGDSDSDDDDGAADSDDDEADAPDGAVSDDGADDDDAFSLAEGSDADDLISLDAAAPAGLIPYDGPDASGDEEEEWGGFGGAEPDSKKRKRREEGKERRKRLRALPTFASYEDYARMIEDAPEDDI